MYFNFLLKIILILLNLTIISNSQEKCGDESLVSQRNNCFGIFKYENGDQYEGYWKNNLFHGEGKYLYANGDTYEGNWVKNKKNGYGIFRTIGNDKYTGFFKNNLFDGYGVFTRNDLNSPQLITALFKAKNSSYEGYWKEGRFNGFGKFYYTDNDGNEFLKSGVFKNSKLEGEGYEILIGKKNNKFKKNIYIGSFLNNNKNGYGHFFQYIFNERPKLTNLHSEKNLESLTIVHFKNDLMHGNGKSFQCQHQFLLTTPFLTIVKPGNQNRILTHQNDNKCWLNFFGTYKNGNRNGLGRLITFDELHSPKKILVYEGSFKDDTKFGFGVSKEFSLDGIKLIKNAELFKKYHLNLDIEESNFNEIWVYDRYFGLINLFGKKTIK